MLHRTLQLWKINRKWTKSAITSASSAHFPDRVKVDPSLQRTAENTSAKETRNWTLTEDQKHISEVSTLLQKAPPFVQKRTKEFQLYRELVRFDKPVGWQLLAIPCFWGSSLAVSRALAFEGADPLVLFAPFIPAHLMVSFILGAYLMRSAGCIVNDMWDREFDRKVERTASRPLASGAISMPTASLILVSHVAAAGFIAINLSPAALTACLAITPVWIMYPFMKRITYAPQFFLGLCFNWGIFVGYAAVLGRVDLAVTLPIYCSAVLWTILYDTIYAYQDRRDDLKCGVKSTAIWVGDRKYILQAMVPIAVLGMIMSGVTAPQTLPFYVGMIFSSIYLYVIVDDVNIYDAWSCANGFKRNVKFGVFVWISMCLGNLVWAYCSEHEREKDTHTDTAQGDSNLLRYLYLNQEITKPTYNPGEYNALDRIAHPAFIQAELAKKKGEEPPAVPAWMRREYIGENIVTILRLLGIEEKTIEGWQKNWYDRLDHYNLYSKFTW
ncbi:4-hydroxybenzoate hexaprenyltransferase [Angomonas deanei]|uniref:4-hydroxybenzoate polyprenyltransferase, mitochondrial n=1 Tax=Angomonas deanei TaxID=59799 RepID=A0A7G2CHS3_9TRYP|nr:4-hydroxybenzoate hexaprenyltransferase [Angomonas deanei]CAD2218905.1 UbiA prenyltransferase family, putative [Angomonas deanei]|eukprot:EPY28993.1 4-hydroxybenzoate hexaprenyltransferase [Angomonas deanei]